MAYVAVGADALQPLAAATVRQEMQNWVSFPNFWLAHGENWDINVSMLYAICFIPMENAKKHNEFYTSEIYLNL